MEASRTAQNTTAFQPLLLKWFSFIAGLFVFDIILGFNGRMLIVGGIPIRMLLYAAFSLILFLMLIDAIAAFRRVKTEKSLIAGLLKLVRPVDLAIAAFLLLNAVWILIVPAITGYGITMAMKQTVAFSMLAFYFPLMLLIRLGYLSWAKSHRLIIWMLFGLAALHIFLYIGELAAGDQTFALRFFDAIGNLTGGRSELPTVVYAEWEVKHFVRIIFPNSIFLTFMFYFFIVGKPKGWQAAFYAVGFVALLTTLTKSLWLGCFLGLLVVLAVCIVDRRRYQAYWRTILAYLTLTLAVTIILNSVLFDNYITARLNSFFAISNVADPTIPTNINNGIDITLQSREMKAADEFDVTERANQTRLIQTQKLLEKWKQSPWFGFGYGSYADDYLRSTDKPYLYEMLLPSLLMQIGVVGLLVWASFFSLLLYWLYRNRASNLRNTVGIVYVFIALISASQFNPFLLGTSAMSILLFCFIQMQQSWGAASKAA